jgi:uncharacterized membrane protein
VRILDVITILCTGLMIGNELAVSLFVNPVLWKLEDRVQATALSLFARLLGKAMPFWYVLCLLLMIAETCLRRHEPALNLLLIAVGLWTAVIFYTISMLVPINNRIAAMGTGSQPAKWQQEHRRWDTLHRWRILFLAIAFVCLLLGVLG